MGTMRYGSEPFEVDDATLAHLAIVVVTKIRRHEPVLVCIVTTDARTSLWVHRASTLRFAYGTPEPRPTDRLRLEAMMREANSPSGIVVEGCAAEAPTTT